MSGIHNKDMQNASVPLDHPKRSYPVLFSLETPENIELLQDSYRVNTSAKRKQLDQLQQDISDQIRFNQLEISGDPFEHHKINQSALVGGNGFTKKRHHRNHHSNLISKVGITSREENHRETMPEIHKESSVFTSQQKQARKNLLSLNRKPQESIDPIELVRSQQLSNILSEPNDNIFQRMVKNIKNAKQDEIHAQLSTERTNRDTNSLTGHKSTSLNLMSQRYDRRYQVEDAPITHRVVHVSNDLNSMTKAPTQNQTITSDPNRTIEPWHQQSHDTMYSQETAAQQHVFNSAAKVHILSQPLSPRDQRNQSKFQSQVEMPQMHHQSTNVPYMFGNQYQRRTVHSSNRNQLDVAPQSVKNCGQTQTNFNSILPPAINERQMIMLSDRGQRPNNDKDQLFNTFDQQKGKPSAFKNSGKKIESAANTSTADGQDDQLIEFQKSLMESEDNANASNIHTPQANVAPVRSTLNHAHNSHFQSDAHNSQENELTEEQSQVNRSCYGLPHIAGPITGKQSIRTGGYTNTNIQNNGLKYQATLIDTDDNFKMVRQRRKQLNLDATSDVFSFGNQTLSHRNFQSTHHSSSKQYLHTQKPMSPQAVSIGSQEFDKRSNAAVPTFPKLKLNRQNRFNVDSQMVSELESAGLLGAVNQVQQSNNNFSQMFKNCSANFKSPIQKKLTVLVNAGNQQNPERYMRIRKKRAKSIKDNVELNIVDHDDDYSQEEFSQNQRNMAMAPEISVHSGTKSRLDSKSNIESKLSMMNGQQGRPNRPSRLVIGPRNPQQSQKGSALTVNSALSTNVGMKILHRLQSDKRQQEEAIIPEETEEEPPDEVTGLQQQKYMFKDGFNDMVELLDQLREKRAQESTVKKTVSTIAEELGIDLEKLTRDVEAFVNKRTLIEAAQKGFKAAPNDCVIMKKSMNFLKGLDFRYVDAPDKQIGSLCSHKSTEEDNAEEYVKEYYRFLKFVHYLRDLLSEKQKIPKQMLILRLINDVKNMTNLNEKEKELFQNEEYATKLLFHPLLQIVTTMEEINGIKIMQDLDNKRKHAPGTNSISSKGNIEMTNATKGIIERIADDLLNDKPAEVEKTIVKKLEPMKSYDKLKKRTLQDEQAQQIHETTEKFRIETVQKFQEDLVKNCMQRRRPPVTVDPNKMDPEDVEQRGHVLFKVDELISEQMSKTLEIMKKEAIKFDKIDQERKKSARKRKEADDKESGESAGEDQNLVKQERQKSILGALQNFNLANLDSFKYAPAIPQESKMIFSDLGSNQKFFKQAKQEIPGYNGEPNQESEFYRDCERIKLLPQPIYKFISNNTLRVQSKRLGGGYIKPLAKFIQTMTQKNKHLKVMRIHLDDCGMNDEDCALLLEGCLKSPLGFALESLTIARNEIGPKTIHMICECLEMCDRVGSAKSLRELCLSNLLIKNMKHLRVLFQKLESYGEQLACLRFQSMNLNDNDILDSICSNLRGNQTLHTLEMSSCYLQINQLMEIVDNLDGCSSLRVLDISDNMVSDMKEESQVKQFLFLQKLGNYLTSQSATLYSLNLQGLFLGRKLLYLAEKIKQNNTLMQVNLTKNELSLIDEEQVMDILRSDADMNETCQAMFIQKPYESMLEQFDPDFLIKLNKYKIEHMKVDQRDKIVQDAVKSSLDNSIKQISIFSKLKPKTPKTSNELMVNQIVNTGIMKELRSNKLIKMQLSQNARLGEVNVSTALTRINTETDGMSQVDELLLRRPIGYNEFIFPEFGTGLLEHIDFDKQYRWTAIKRNIQSQSWMHNILELQYLLVYVDTQKIHQEFEQITDKDTIKMLMNQYGLHAYSENHDQQKRKENPMKDEYQRKDLNQPIIFGSFSDWRAYQMLRTYQYACILSSSFNLEERQCLMDFVFDDVNCDLLKNFKSIYSLVYQIISAVITLHNAHAVGKVPLNPKEQKSPDRTTFIYSCLCPPGKHSLFIFDPSTNKIYKKVIVVDPQTRPLMNRKSIIEAELTDSKMIDKKQKPMMSLQYFNDVVNRSCNKVLVQQPRDIIESFLLDTQQKNLPLQNLYLNEINGHKKTLETLQVLKKYYPQLVQIFKQLHSESMRTVKKTPAGRIIKKETYPFISFESLRNFCEKTQICQAKKLENTIKDRKKKSPAYVDGQIADSIFENMNRPKFLYFVVWLSVEVLKTPVEQVIKKQFLPLLDSHEEGQLPFEKRIEEIEPLLNHHNKGYIRDFCTRFKQLYGNMKPKDLFDHVHGVAGVFISEFNFLKFYALSKKIVPYEILDTNRSYFSLDTDELIELIFRTTEFVYNPENYTEEKAEILRNVSGQMDLPVTQLFKMTMESIINAPIKENEVPKVALLEESELETIEEVDKMMRYLPEIQKPQLFAQVEKDYDHMVEMRRQVRERKLEKLNNECK